MSIRDVVGRILTAIPYRKFERSCRNPEAAQAKVWRECRNRLLGPYWLGFSDENGGLPERLEDFPISVYEDYSESIRSALSGTLSPLTGDRVRFWCTSSGTSGERKLFPLTRAHFRQSSRTAAPQFNRLLREFPGFFDGKLLTMAAPDSGERSAAGIPIVLLSTSFYLRAPAIAEPLLAIPRSIQAEARRFETWASLYSEAADLTAIVGMTPLGTVRLLESIERDWDRNRSILLGESPLPPGLPPLRMSGKRRRHLRALLSERSTPGERNLRSINRLWPNLRAIFGWKSSIAAAQLPLLEAYLTEPTPLLDGQYSATEAWFNVPLSRDLGGPLHLGAHVFEFLPVDSEPRRENVLKPWELEAGRDYEILITNAMGLVRYRIFDVVRCLGFHHRSPIVSFRSKSRGRIGLDSSTVRESEIVEALTLARIPADGSVLVSPSPISDRLVLYFLSDSPSADLLIASVGRFDDALRKSNDAYSDSRKSGTTLVPIPIRVPADSAAADRIFPKRGASGIRAQEKAVAVAVRSPIDLESFRGLQNLIN